MESRATFEGSLAGLRVLDLSRILAGPLCAQFLGDHGAEVIKVEAPSHDETRSWGPPFVRPGVSAYFNAINRSKDNICLDLGSPDGQRVLNELLVDADVLVENFKAGTLARWGLPDSVLERRYPRLIHCRITGFGTDGPMGGHPGYDAVVQAYSGLMSINGDAAGPAVRVGVPIVDMVTGFHAFSGILLALHERHRSGRGQLIDCTLLDTAISLLHPHSASYLTDGCTPNRTGSAHPTVAPYDTFDARDGQIFIGVGSNSQFKDFAELLDLPEVAGDPRFATNAGRLAHLDELRSLLAQRIALLDRYTLADTLLAQGIPASAVRTVPEALEDAQVRYRGMVVDLDGHEAVGIPIKLNRTPGRARSATRDQGADTRRILANLGYDVDQIDALIAADVAREHLDHSELTEASVYTR